MLGLLPPSSSVTRFSDRPHLAPISRPTTVEPVNATLSTPGVVDQRRAGLAVAGEHVQRPLREAGLERQLAEPQRGQRRLLGRLEDDRAAGGERRGDLPHRHQQREVPGHDLGADADRLAYACSEHVAGRDRHRLALDLGRPAGVVAQVGDRGGDVALGRRQRLAVVERLELGELVAVGLDQLRERVDQPGALRRRRPCAAAPRTPPAPRRRRDRRPRRRRGRRRRSARRSPGRCVSKRAPVGRRRPLAADQQLERVLGDEVARGGRRGLRRWR